MTAHQATGITPVLVLMPSSASATPFTAASPQAGSSLDTRFSLVVRVVQTHNQHYCWPPLQLRLEAQSETFDPARSITNRHWSVAFIQHCPHHGACSKIKSMLPSPLARIRQNVNYQNDWGGFAPRVLREPIRSYFRLT